MARAKPKSTKRPVKKKPHYKLNRFQNRKKLLNSPAQQKKQPKPLEQPTEPVIAQPEIVPEPEPPEIVPEPIIEPKPEESIEGDKFSQNAVLRAQKQFFHIVLNQSASNLQRFLRTNAELIEIDAPMLDTKLQKPRGPFCGWSALHIASFRGLVDMIQILLDHGANINVRASLQTETPLAVATWKENESVVEYLIERGADIHARNDRRGGQQPIHISCINGNESIIRILIKHGADIYSRTSSNGAQAPIELAARMGRLPLVQAIHREYNVNITTLLPFSLLSNHPETISYALDHTDIGENNWSWLLDEAIGFIHKSLKNDIFRDTVSKLGCKFNWLNSPNIFPFRIIQSGLTDIFKTVARTWILKSPQRIKYFQYSSQSLLYYACACNEYEISKFLLEEANNSPDSEGNGETALIRSAKDGTAEICSLLLKHGASYFSLSQTSLEIALHAAARNNQSTICSILLSNTTHIKKQLQCVSASGMTPLHVAASKLQLQTITVLLNAGAVIDFRNPKTNCTALHYACTMNSDANPNHRISVIDLLLNNGADISLKCDTVYGKQGVVELACVSPQVVGHLIARGAPEVSIEELNKKREEYRKQLGQILIFEDSMSPMEDKIIHNPQQFALEKATRINQAILEPSSRVTFQPPPTKPWKTVRLFLSSTFIDMQSERELLIKRVIPRVKAICAKRNIHLIDIDLRWGVTEAEVQTGKALEVCLQEAQQADIFCGLLGSRYGWVPKNIPESIQDKYLWKPGYSITHMEIQTGVFNRFVPHSNTLDGVAAFFCMRNDSVYQNLKEEFKESFVEPQRELLQSIHDLKKEIQSKKLPVIQYEPRVEFRSGFPHFYELESFARDFETQLLQAIHKLHPEESSQTPHEEQLEDPLLRERNFHQTFIEMRSCTFLGRSAVIQSIEDAISESFLGLPIVVVSGEAGSGKSSLMAKVVTKYAMEHSLHEVFVLGHFVGGSPSSVSVRNTLHRLNEEIIRAFEFTESVENDFEELKDQFVALLQRVSTRGHKQLLIFIDALNQLDASNQSHNLSWLPLTLPKNVSIVVSCLPSDCLRVLQDRKETIHISVPQLSNADRIEIIAETLGKYQKKLTETQQVELLSKPGTTNPLFLTMAVEELRIFGNFEKLEEKIRSIADDVPSLMDQILRRLEDEFGAEIVRNSLGLLETSRFGLLEEELLEMSPSLSRYQWSEFFLAIKFYLRPVGSSASENILDFFHRQFSKAVHKRYLQENPQLSSDLHSTLANYFLSKIAPHGITSFTGTDEYPRGYSEVIYHLFHSTKNQQALQSLLTSLPFIEKKCLLGFTYDLMRDYLLVSTTSNNSLKDAIRPYMEFCMSNTHFMDEFPYTILQMAMNQLESSPIYSAAVKLRKQQTRRRGNKSELRKVTPMVEWKNKPTVERNRQEFRKFNIGARANSSRGSPDAKLLAVGDIFGRVKLFNATTAEELAVLLQSNIRVTCVDFSPDGNYLIAASGPYLYFFDVQSKTMLHQINISKDNQVEVLCCTFSPQKNDSAQKCSIAVGTSDGYIFLVQVLPSDRGSVTVQQITQHSHAVNCCAFTPTGNEILVGSKVATLLSLTGKVIRKFEGHSKAIKGCAVSSKGDWCVTCSQDRLLMVWDIAKGSCVAKLEGHVDMVESCSITHRDQFIVSGSWDKRVILWDVESIFKSNGNAPVFAVLGEHAHFLNDVHSFGNDAVVSSSADMTVKLLRLPSGSLAEFKEESEGAQNHHTELVCGMDYDPNHQWIGTGSWDKHAKLLNRDGTQVVDFATHTKRVNDVCFAPSSFSFIVSASMDHTLKLWDLGTFENTKTFSGHYGNVMAVVVSHDDRYIASGSSDKTIKFWDAATGNCIDTINAHTSWVDTLRFSKCSRMLASASVDGEAKVWNTNNGVLLAHLRKHSAPILDVQWAADDAYLITVGEDWKIRVWEAGTWECLRVIEGHKHEVTSSCILENDEKLCELFQCKSLMVTSSADQTIRFWDYLTGEQLWIYCGEHAYSYIVYIGELTFAAGDSRGGVHLLTVSTNN